MRRGVILLLRLLGRREEAVGELPGERGGWSFVKMDQLNFCEDEDKMRIKSIVMSMIDGLSYLSLLI
jgi:hypothetical protein